MKKTGYTFFLFAVMLLSSCIVESLETTEEMIREVSGVMQIGGEIYGGEAADKLKTIRFLVFKDALTSPKLELNTLEDMPLATSGDEITEFNVLLEVSYRTSGPNEKMVFAIVNEPAQMKTKLESITSYTDLQNLELDFAHFLNSDHRTLLITGMPMSGMVQTNKVFPTASQAEANLAKLTLERAVARVDVYLRKETGVTIDFTTASKIELKKTYNKQNFIYHQDEQGNSLFGQIRTVAVSDLNSSQNTKEWKPANAIQNSTIPDNGDGLLLCSFYTAERTCTAANDTDKLVLNLELVCSDGSVRKGELVLNEAYKDGVLQDIEVIRRNNNYKIIATVESQPVAIPVRVEVTDWEDGYYEDVTPGTYFFSIEWINGTNPDNFLNLSGANHQLFFKITCTYPDGWTWEFFHDDVSGMVNWGYVTGFPIPGFESFIQINGHTHSADKEPVIRTGWMHFKAGNLTKIVKIMQKSIVAA